MAINPKCDVVDCGKELTDFGGIVMSPPNSEGYVRKVHICKDCFPKLTRFIDVTGLKKQAA